MNKTFLPFSLILVCVLALPPEAPCPLNQYTGSIISAQVTVGENLAIIPLLSNQDIACYNYSLPYSFREVPEVAVAVSDFENRASNHLYFSIKPLQTDSLNYIPFLVRTQWRYTYWIKITFSFLAEDRSDIEANYYQIDSGNLGNCYTGKQTQILLPFRRPLSIGGTLRHSLFLHGFEITTVNSLTNSYSPFQIQIAQSRVNLTGIAISISAISQTRIHTLFISYIAWASDELEVISGVYIYDSPLFPLIGHTPSKNIGPNYARIYGVTGFLVSHIHQNLELATSWSGNKFSFNLGKSQYLTKYFSFQYAFFIGSQCSTCPGYSYYYKGKCQKVCPAGTYPTEKNTCIECGQGHFWTGTECRKICPKDQYHNKITDSCECPEGAHWTGTKCLSCSNGQIFDEKNNLCKCQNPWTIWNGYSCQSIDQCTQGKKWNIFSFICECPPNTIWNGTFCEVRTQCYGGQIVTSLNKCECPQGTFLKDLTCQVTGCFGGQKWNGYQCECEKDFHWNGTVCLICINGQLWNQQSNSCLCPGKYHWNGHYCEYTKNCSEGRVYSSELRMCICPEDTFWNGAACMKKPHCCCGQIWDHINFECICLNGFNWDGQKCVSCLNGKIWNKIQGKCDCSEETQWNGQFCAVKQICIKGMKWNQNIWSCECPSSTVWNGELCVINPCVGGKVWDSYLKKCICVGGKVWINDKCTYQESLCSYGRVWSPSQMKCICPNGKWDSGNSCETIPTCYSNERYNFLNHKCQCLSGLVWIESKQSCGDPNCLQGSMWNGSSCADIQCPPGSYFNGSQCICPFLSKQCSSWQYYDGNKCVYYPAQCPHGTRWNLNACISYNDCPIGYYSQGDLCKPFPQRCIPPTFMNKNGNCVIIGTTCPKGSYFSNGTCQPYLSCQNGETWNYNLLKCACPQGTGWNGKECLKCNDGKIWDPFEGCICPKGYFLSASLCEKVEENRCKSIPNSFWDDSEKLCLCHPGFISKGFSCICKGIPFDNFCDRCGYLPNSEWNQGVCRCKQGFLYIRNQCLPASNGGADDRTDCSVGTFFHQQQKKCLSCPIGCLNCNNSFECKTCNIYFYYDYSSSHCSEICGDGRKFVLECDDGNNIDGDGCSRSCQIEEGFMCKGGSPTSPDTCQIYQPHNLSLKLLGQIRYSTRIDVNIQVDYLPKQLLQSHECLDQCGSILQIQVLSASIYKPISQRSQLIPGSRYIFTNQLQFSSPYMGIFTLRAQVKPSLKKYFNNVDMSSFLEIQVNPSYLATAQLAKDYLI